MLFWLCVALLVTALIPTVITWAPHWLASTSGLGPSDRVAEVGRVRTALLAVLAGSIAVVGAYYTARTFALNQQGQITERFTRAVDQLGNDDHIDVRLGGIYALERLARESRDDFGPIIEILTAYVRVRMPNAAPPRQSPGANTQPDEPGPSTEPGGAGVAMSLPRPTTDVQAALTVLCRRSVPRDVSVRMDLGGTQLTRADFSGGNLSRADFRRAILMRANLREANLSEANLRDANLSRANLSDADLSGAILSDADLSGAILSDADLSRAKLSDADLSRAILPRANLREARLSDADLSRAILPRANLREANLSDAHLSGADLSGAELRRANLSEARLVGANLSGADLSGANLTGTNFIGAGLSGAYLLGTDLSAALITLCGPDGRMRYDRLGGATSHEMKDALFEDAKYDKATTWPDGFDPAAHGARLVP